MADGPGNTQQPPNMPNVDPAMADILARMATSQEAMAGFLKDVKENMAGAADEAAKFSKNLDKEKISTIVGYFDEFENKLAEINRHAKKFMHSVSSLKGTKEAAMHAEEMAKALKDALGSQKSFGAGASVLRRHIQAWEKAAKGFGGEIRELSSGEMADLTKLAERTAKAGSDFAKSMKSVQLGKFGDFIKGAAATTKPGYVNQLKDRWADIKGAYQGPRMARMAAGGAEGGEAAAGMTGAITGLVDAIEGGVGALEVGMEALSGPLGWLVIAVEALIAVFEKYVKQNKDMEAKLGKGGIFTGNAMTDVTGTTVGGEDAFQRTRRALTPRGLGVNELGVSWQRNLDIAGAMAGGGYGMKGMFQDTNLGGGNAVANVGQGYGNRDFAGGGFGQVQRTVMGVGRVLGMSDAEGVQEVLKMLEQYSQTLDSTERFLAQIEKDTDAAGISTTKYLKIIDEVSGHFNKMNKELGQTIGIMRELSRSGAVSSEVLKDMMEFLTQDQKPDVGGIAQRIFAQEGVSKETMKYVQQAADATVQSGMEAFNDQLTRQNKAGDTGVGVMDTGKMKAMLAKGDVSGASALLDQAEVAIKRSVAAGKMSKDQGQQLDQSLQSLREGVSISGGTRGNAYQRAAAESAGLTSPAMTAALNLSKVQAAAERSGLSMGELISGQTFAGGKFNKDQSTSAILFLKQLGEVYQMTPDEARRKYAETMTEQGTGMVASATARDASGAFTDQAKANAQAMTKEVFTKWKAKGGMPPNKAMQKYMMDQGETLDSIMGDGAKSAEFLKAFPDLYKSMDSLGNSIIKSASEQQHVDDASLNLELDKARKIGRQTQSLADAVGGVFSKWFTKIISWLEYIANAIGWMVKKASLGLFGTPEQQKADRQKSFNTDIGKISDTLTDLPKELEDVNKKQTQLELKNGNKPMGQWSKADQEQYNKLDEIAQSMRGEQMVLQPEKDQGYYGSADEMDDSQKALKDFADQMNDLKKITVDTTSAVSGAAQAQTAAAGGASGTNGGNTQTNYYSSNATIDQVPPMAPNTSPESNRSAMMRRPMDDK